MNNQKSIVSLEWSFYYAQVSYLVYQKCKDLKFSEKATAHYFNTTILTDLDCDIEDHAKQIINVYKEQLQEKL